MHITAEKDQLRQAVKERLQRLTEPEREAESRSLCRRLLPHIEPDVVVCAYSAMRTEASLNWLIRELLERNQAVYLPCFAENQLVFRQYRNGDALQKGQLNVQEPAPDAPLLDDSRPLLVLLPGLAFDTHGGRLGRGNGGYDRWLEQIRLQNNTIQTVGIALQCQLVDRVPMEPHDQPLDALVTAREYQECSGSIEGGVSG